MEWKERGKEEGGRRKERKEERNGKENKEKERSDMAQENKTNCIENRLLVDRQQYCLFLPFRKSCWLVLANLAVGICPEI